MSNSHSGALLACINRTALGGSTRGAGIGSGSGGDVTTAALVILLALALTGGLSNGLSILLVLVDGPIEDVVVLETLADEKVAEDLAQVRVVRLVVEAKRAGVVEVDGKLIGEATAENLGGSRHLLLHDTIVLLLLGSSLESLPGEGSTAEVEHDISERLHVITTGLLYQLLA